MNVFKMLQDLGGRLGVIHVVSSANGAAAPGGPKKLATRAVTLQDLTAEVQADEVRVLAEMPAELSVEFAKVFEAAGIKPPAHGWTIDRLVGLLRTDQYRTMDTPSVQKAVLGLLANEKATVEDVVKDALARDRSLDAYDEFVRKKMQDRSEARQRRVSALQSQIKDLEQQCARQAEEGRADQERLEQWLDRKASCELDMAWALGFLVKDPAVSVTRPGERK